MHRAQVTCQCGLPSKTKLSECYASEVIRKSYNITSNCLIVCLHFFLISVQTDILISMHGAGLTHVLFMPSSAGLIELFPQYIPYRPHFKVLSEWRKISYLKWTNMEGQNELPNFKTRIPTDAILRLVEQMIRLLSEKPKALKKNILRTNNNSV